MITPMFKGMPQPFKAYVSQADAVDAAGQMADALGIPRNYKVVPSGIQVAAGEVLLGDLAGTSINWNVVVVTLPVVPASSS